MNTTVIYIIIIIETFSEGDAHARKNRLRRANGRARARAPVYNAVVRRDRIGVLIIIIIMYTIALCVIILSGRGTVVVSYTLSPFYSSSSSPRPSKKKKKKNLRGPVLLRCHTTGWARERSPAPLGVPARAVVLLLLLFKRAHFRVGRPSVF